MRTQGELEATRDVRRVMVRHWIDLGRLSIRCQGGRLMLYGLLQRVPGVTEPLTPPIVESIFQQVKRINGVRSVSAHLENWTNQGGMWRLVEGYAEDKRGSALPGRQEAARGRDYTMTVEERRPQE